MKCCIVMCMLPMVTASAFSWASALAVPEQQSIVHLGLLHLQ